MLLWRGAPFRPQELFTGVESGGATMLVVDAFHAAQLLRIVAQSTVTARLTLRSM